MVCICSWVLNRFPRVPFVRCLGKRKESIREENSLNKILLEKIGWLSMTIISCWLKAEYDFLNGNKKVQIQKFLGLTQISSRFYCHCRRNLLCFVTFMLFISFSGGVPCLGGGEK